MFRGACNGSRGVCGGTAGGGGLISVFEEFSAIVGKAFVLAGGWAMGYHLLGFRKFPDISLFHGILSLFFFSCVGTQAPPAARILSLGILSLKSLIDL